MSETENTKSAAAANLTLSFLELHRISQLQGISDGDFLHYVFEMTKFLEGKKDQTDLPIEEMLVEFEASYKKPNSEKV